MRAAIVETAGKLVIRDIPEPEPGEYEALCEIPWGATCVATDWHIIEDSLFFAKVNYPAILGHESVGRVVEVGAKVRHLKKGDWVARVGTPSVGGFSAWWGGLAEYGIARDHQAMREDGLPEGQWRGEQRQKVFPRCIDPAGATMLITWRETFSFINRMGVRPDADVLVLGSGGNGLSFALHARNLGARRVMMIGSGPRREVAERAGVEGFVDYRTENWPEALRGLDAPRFDVVIDSIGQADGLDRVLPFLKPGGALSVYGIENLSALAIRPLTAGGSFTFFNGGYDEAESHDAVVQYVLDGKLDPALFLDLANPYPLEHIAEAYQAVRERKHVKALIRVKD